MNAGVLFMQAWQLINNPPTDLMMAAPMTSSEEQNPIVINPNYELFLFALTIISVANMVLMFFSDDLTKQVVSIIDGGICVIFLVDFAARSLRTRPVRKYWIESYGWMDFIGSLPIPILRVVRLARYGLLARKLRKSDLTLMGKITVKRRAQSTLLMVLLATILILEISGIVILKVESASRTANIATASDAIWWNLVTIATVGYGDRYPVTNQGRIVGVFVMTVGVGLFSVFTSFLADWFRRSREEPRLEKRIVKRELVGLKLTDPEKEESQPVDDIRSQLQEARLVIEKLELTHQDAINELKERLDRIENNIGSSQ